MFRDHKFITKYIEKQKLTQIRLYTLKYHTMGNYCCPQQQTAKKHEYIRPIQSTKGYTPQAKRSLSESRLQMQKSMLEEYPHLVRFIKQYGQQPPKVHYKKFYYHHYLGADQLSASYIGELIDQNDTELQCLVKIIDKSKVQSINQKRKITVEYLISRYLNYHFILNCIYFYEDETKMYLFFEWRGYEYLKIFAPGIGDPEFVAYFERNKEKSIKFIAAGIILGLQKLHQLGIVYRSINFESIAITQNGYPVLSNMSRVYPEGKGDAVPAASSFTSPQEFRGQPVTASSDFWALGVLIYYLCRGQFINYTGTFREGQFHAEGVSKKLIDFVNELLMVRPERRLGCNGVMSLKYHSFFDDLNWKQFQQMSLESPLAQGMTTLPHPKDSLSKDYGQTNSMQTYYDNFYSPSSLASMLLIDVATIMILNECFSGNNQTYEVEEEPTPVYNIEENQMATEIDLGGDFDYGDD